MTVTWLSLDLRRRWRSLIVLALLVALTAGTVLAAVAGALRGQSAFDRLWARTDPATVAVLANEPGFDWSRVEALPEVSDTGLIIVYYGATVDGGGVVLGFPPGNAALMRTVERPVVLQGRMSAANRADEVVVTAHFLTAHRLRVGDPLTLHLSSPAQATAGFNATNGGKPLGPLAVPLPPLGQRRGPHLRPRPRYRRQFRVAARVPGDEPRADRAIQPRPQCRVDPPQRRRAHRPAERSRVADDRGEHGLHVTR